MTAAKQGCLAQELDTRVRYLRLTGLDGMALFAAMADRLASTPALCPSRPACRQPTRKHSARCHETTEDATIPIRQSHHRRRGAEQDSSDHNARVRPGRLSSAQGGSAQLFADPCNIAIDDP